MRGSYLHNQVLLEPIRLLVVNAKSTASREHPVTMSDGARGAIDLVVERDGLLLAIEGELTADRVSKDVEKAIALGAGDLLIVTPNSAVRKAVRRRLRREVPSCRAANLRAFALTQPQALQHLARHFAFSSALIPTQNTTQQRIRRTDRL